LYVRQWKLGLRIRVNAAHGRCGSGKDNPLSRGRVARSSITWALTFSESRSVIAHLKGTGGADCERPYPFGDSRALLIEIFDGLALAVSSRPKNEATSGFYVFPCAVRRFTVSDSPPRGADDRDCAPCTVPADAEL